MYFDDGWLKTPEQPPNRPCGQVVFYLFNGLHEATSSVMVLHDDQMLLNSVCHLMSYILTNEYRAMTYTVLSVR